jgi:zinc transporter
MGGATIGPGGGPALAGRDGFAWGFRFASSGTCESVTADGVQDLSDTNDGWLWLNCDLGDDKLPAALGRLSGLPPVVRALLLSTDDKLKADTFGLAIAGVSNDYEKRTPIDVRRGLRWRFAVLPNLLVTVCSGQGHSLSQVSADIMNGRQFRGPLHLLAALINEFSLTSFSLLVEISDRINESEEQMLDGPEKAGSEFFGHLRRRLLYLHRQVVPIFAFLTNLMPQRPSWVDEADVADFRRVAERLDSLHDDIELLRERAHTLQEDFTAREAERANRRLTVLTVVSAVLLPPTFITGLLGMNVGGLPLQHSPHGFLIAAAVMAASMIAMLLILRYIRML